MLQPAVANETAAQQEATRQPYGASKGGGTSRGCGATRSHATTNRANMGGDGASVCGGVGDGVGRAVATVG
jgi:hypothetical protein